MSSFKFIIDENINQENIDVKIDNNNELTLF